MDMLFDGLSQLEYLNVSEFGHAGTSTTLCRTSESGDATNDTTNGSHYSRITGIGSIMLVYAASTSISHLQKLSWSLY